MGKSSTGKDTIKKALLNNPLLHLTPMIMDTTRPPRKEEVDGIDYNFIKDLDDMLKKNENNDYVVVSTYKVYDNDGFSDNWYYGVPKVYDNNIYIGSGALSIYEHLVEYYGESIVKPIYLVVDDKDRLMRSITRESNNNGSNYKEICRRYISDETDFADEKIKGLGIKKYHIFKNGDSIMATVSKISSYIIQNSVEERNMIAKGK